MAPKAKKEKMSLGAFLSDENYGSWADEMEDMPLPSTDNSRTSYGGGERRAFSSAGGMGGASFDRPQYSVREQLPLPTEPPFTAHIGNMSFDTTAADLEDFFKDCAVTNVRIVEDKLDRKPKGFAYVEFGTLDGLKKALSYGGTSLGGRMVRVSVAEPPKEKESSRDFSDWSRKGPLPDLPQQRRVSDRGGFGNRFDSGASDAGSDRAPSRRGFESDGKVRDFGNWERKGPLSPMAPAAGSLREGGRQKSRDGPAFRHNSPAWGEGRSQDGSRPPRREFQEKPVVQREPTAAERDNQWRANMRPDAPAKSPTPTPSREASNPPSPAQPPAPAGRPKLNLQKRTVSEAVPASPAPETGDSKASPFGAARPIDTSAREKEIAEKRELALRQKREADEKERAEKAEQKRLAKEAKEKAVGDKMANARNAPAAANGKGEEEEETPAPKPKFEVLRRATSEGANGMTADEDEDAEVQEEAAATTEDKEVKPKTVVRDAPSTKTNGNWRGASKAEGKTGKTENTATNLEEEGWSTIPTKQRSNRRGNQGQRAIAS